MSAETDHPVFQPPDNRNVKIWRYMDFTKYVSMLINSALFFTRSDLFDDPYEGATSQGNNKLRPKIYKNIYGMTYLPDLEERAFKSLSEHIRRLRKHTFINCWHMNGYESAAMWKIYSKTNEAIAIQSTYQKLHSSLKSEIYVGVVNYIDYEKDWIPEGNTLWPFVHKRKSFEHEKELRALTQDRSKPSDKLSKVSGKSIHINFEDLVEKVYISPDAPSWFYTLVQEVTKKFGRKVDIKQSTLGKEPIY